LLHSGGYRVGVAGRSASSRAGVLAGGLAALALLGGCTQAAAPSGGASPSATASTSAVSRSASTSRSATPKPAVTGEPSLGGRCEDLLPVGTVNIALRRNVVGRTAFIRGVAEPDIGRLTYLNCRYGIPAPVKGKPAPAPQVEIGISLYNSPAQANRRVLATVEYYSAHGAKDRTVPVGSVQGVVLSGYGMPTLVVAAGPRTVAISVSPKLLTAGSTAELASLAKAVLDASAHYTLGSAAASASPSTTG
jgi:hypothetical protein